LDFLTAHGADLAFFVFAAIAVVGALGVVTLRNPMYGAVALLLTFLAIAVLFLLRHAEFLAVVQVFVYGGGIMVLFLFVIMLVNQHQLMEVDKYANHWWLALVVVLVLGVIFIQAFLPIVFSDPAASSAAFTEVDGQALGNSQAVAWQLYRQYLMPFEIVSVFLLVAMVGAVVLGRRQ
jgi:NADH-quinone oxidoreductase subunit J